MRTLRIAGPIALLLVLAAFPQVFRSPEITGIAVLTLLYATAATSWNIFSGYTGYIALGHAAFFGVGSYAIAIMCSDWHVPGGYLPFLLLPLAGLAAAVVSVPLGWISLRTRRHTFIVITIAIFFIMQLLAFNLRGITHGSAGMELPIPAAWGGAFFNIPFYYATLAMLLTALAVSWWIRNSKYGLGLLAIRDDEDRALGLGVDTGPAKLAAFVISAFFVGMVGAMHAYFLESIFPAFAFDPLFDVAIALMSFLGGLGTLAGPILGALILEPTQQFFTLQFSQNGVYLIIYGLLFLVIILLLPEGILPTLRRTWSRDRASRSAAPVEALEANGGGGAKPRGAPRKKKKGMAQP
ncbi:MAG TPA: branched-chain amino acid ABC transporter permease [Anaerolineales bacterium]|nr:branched-chain amino acid ABC transporter permease [Anaerolineales bacterium]